MDFGFQPYPLYSNKIHCLKAVTVSLMQLTRALHSTVYTDVKQTLIAQESQGWFPSLHYTAGGAWQQWCPGSFSSTYIVVSLLELVMLVVLVVVVLGVLALLVVLIIPVVQPVLLFSNGHGSGTWPLWRPNSSSDVPLATWISTQTFNFAHFSYQFHSVQGLTKPKKEKTGKRFKGTSHAPVEGVCNKNHWLQWFYQSFSEKVP